MPKLKRIFVDLTSPRDWYWLWYVKRILWKIKDYDRLEYDYCCVLCHATNDRMSESSYELSVIYSEIDDAQRDNHYSVIKDDLNMLIDGGCDVDDIRKYINDLSK
jgi:hypothetical protein